MQLCARGQMPVSTKYEMRGDPGVVRNYGRLLVELAAVVPDGLVRAHLVFSSMFNVLRSRGLEC